MTGFLGKDATICQLRYTGADYHGIVLLFVDNCRIAISERAKALSSFRPVSAQDKTNADKRGVLVRESAAVWSFSKITVDPFPRLKNLIRHKNQAFCCAYI